MPQPSIAYAVGCVRAPSRSPLGQAQMERLLSAPSYEEARKQLPDMGFDLSEDDSIATMAVRALEDTCTFLKRVTPDPELTDAFLLRYDAQNLKSLLKARILGEKLEALSACGTIKPDLLRHAVAERVYIKLPIQIKEALEALEKSMAHEVRPMEIDARIDRAVFAMMLERAKKSGSQTARDYFRDRADTQNAIILLRLHALPGLKPAREDLLLPGGSIHAWPPENELGEKLPKLFSAWPVKVRDAIKRATEDASQIPAFEKVAEDHLLNLWRPFGHEPFAIEALIGWLLAHERAAQAVRLIMAAKLNGFSEEAVRERLRDAYGQ